MASTSLSARRDDRNVGSMSLKRSATGPSRSSNPGHRIGHHGQVEVGEPLVHLRSVSCKAPARARAAEDTPSRNVRSAALWFGQRSARPSSGRPLSEHHARKRYRKTGSALASSRPRRRQFAAGRHLKSRSMSSGVSLSVDAAGAAILQQLVFANHHPDALHERVRMLIAVGGDAATVT